MNASFGVFAGPAAEILSTVFALLNEQRNPSSFVQLHYYHKWVTKMAETAECSLSQTAQYHYCYISKYFGPKTSGVYSSDASKALLNLFPNLREWIICRVWQEPLLPGRIILQLTTYLKMCITWLLDIAPTVPESSWIILRCIVFRRTHLSSSDEIDVECYT